MIKWLQEICVTAEESQNYYHFHDNRVLPSHVDEALANAEGEREHPGPLCRRSAADRALRPARPLPATAPPGRRGGSLRPQRAPAGWLSLLAA